MKRTIDARAIEISSPLQFMARPRSDMPASSSINSGTLSTNVAVMSRASNRDGAVGLRPVRTPLNDKSHGSHIIPSSVGPVLGVNPYPLQCTSHPHFPVNLNDSSTGATSSDVYDVLVKQPSDWTALAKSFPEKLMQVLSQENLSDVITWLPHGKAFVICNPDRFTEEVLPVYFKQAKFSSFTRKLYRWGFRHITKGADANSYYHEMFQRDNASLCRDMFCTYSDGIVRKKKGNKYDPVMRNLNSGDSAITRPLKEPLKMEHSTSSIMPSPSIKHTQALNHLPFTPQVKHAVSDPSGLMTKQQYINHMDPKFGATHIKAASDQKLEFAGELPYFDGKVATVDPILLASSYSSMDQQNAQSANEPVSPYAYQQKLTANIGGGGFVQPQRYIAYLKSQLEGDLPERKGYYANAS